MQSTAGDIAAHPFTWILCAMATGVAASAVGWPGTLVAIAAGAVGYLVGRADQ
jgi:hypothetical protein